MEPRRCPMSENRKLAAILAADVVGYSRLAGADEDDRVTLAMGRELVDSLGLTILRTERVDRPYRQIVWRVRRKQGQKPTKASAL
jgi:hypothetical protein